MSHQPHHRDCPALNLKENRPCNCIRGKSSLPASTCSASTRPKLDKDGVPEDPNDWTAEDWFDLLKGMKRIKAKISKRHETRQKYP
jgi:hypothetical protein